MSLTELRAKFEEELRRENYGQSVDRILETFDFAAAAHADQKRASGEEYVSHPLQVARILMTYGADTDSLIAALLHDVVEDTEYTVADVKKRFGEEVAMLVDGLTKLAKISYYSKEEQQVENLRKMLLAMAKDIRVVLIKLADRLHNMRTLEFKEDEKQRLKALETLEVYAPLAHRLGVQSLKHELEDISLRYLDPVGYSEIEEYLRSVDNGKEKLAPIKEQILSRLKENSIEATVDGRVKQVYSIYRKMFAQNKTIDEIYDLYAVRVIVNTVSDCYCVLGHIHDVFKPMPSRFKDYISTPKPNMYQSLHTTVLDGEGNIFEVQIRTWDMHRTAEFGIAAHWKYKSGVFGSHELDSKLEWVRSFLETQRDMNDADDFMKTFKIDLFADEVFAYTPKGDVFNLPVGSTVIDFAYYIHSAVGNRMTGAKVNGRMVEINTKIQNGDLVEIITSSNAPGPSRDWLKIVATNGAKNKIRQWFKKEKREENIEQGRDDLERELRRNGINLNAVNKEELYAPIMKRYAINDINEFYAAIGYGGIVISKVLQKLKDHYGRLKKADVAEEVAPAPVEKPKDKKAKNGIIVEGLNNCLVKLAHCCDPLPGDEIIGYVTRGYGVTVHKKTCRCLENIDKERLVTAVWDGKISSYYAATLRIVAIDRIDLVAEITVALSNMRIMLRSISKTEMSNGCVAVYVTVEIQNREHLDTVAGKLRKLQSVLEVERCEGKQ